MIKDGINIIKTLRKSGYEAWLVGGCVRDRLLGRNLSDAGGDLDIATFARPEAVMALFKDQGVYAVPSGIDHGTVVVVVDGRNIEVTTYRRDVSTDGRRATVEFGESIEEDLARRDFTMNSVAWDPVEDTLIDPFGGRGDLEKKLIKAVVKEGESPIDRFLEDYLRIFRALRFESTLGFKIDPATEAAMNEAARQRWQDVVSIERIRDEISKCFALSGEPSVMIDGMRRVGVLFKVLPELEPTVGLTQNKYHDFDLYVHTLKTVDMVDKARPLVRWAALLHDLGKVATKEGDGPECTFYKLEIVSQVLAAIIMRRL